MLRVDLAKLKIKRILVVYRELEHMKITHDASMDIMEYIFAISARWLEEILRKHNISEFEAIELPYYDLDMIMLDAFVTKMHKQAQRNRKEQLKLL